MDIKVMKLLYFILCISIDKMYAFNHSMAEAECRENGLVSYRHFVGEEGSDLDKAYDLKEGESAWISGYVNFSQFVAYQACSGRVNNSVLNYTLQENTIYNCLQKCTIQDNILYIGLQNEFCYCSQAHEFKQFHLQPDDYCNPELINSNFVPQTYVSSIKANISLYSIISNKSVSWDQPFSEARGQCVNVRSDGHYMKYKTDSCYSKAYNFICTNSAFHRSLVGNCEFQRLSFCVLRGSNAWMKSFKECSEHNGKLTHFIYTTMKGYLKANVLYWTGIFRTFKIENENVLSENDICLSIKNASGQIRLDPSDCSAEKKYICAGTSSKRINTKVDSKINSVSVRSLTAKTVVENTSITSDTKPVSLETISPTQIKIEDNKPDLIGVYITVGVLVAISLLIIIICVILRKRKQLKTTSSKNRSSFNDQDNAITDNINDALNADVMQGQVLARHSFEEEVTYAKPDIAFKKISSSESDYDRIRIKGHGERKENTAKAETIDDHVYGINSAHPIDSDIEVYDHLEAARKTNVSKPTDGIYNTLAEDSDTYNVLRPGNKEESSKSAVNQTQIKETCPTYDELK